MIPSVPQPDIMSLSCSALAGVFEACPDQVPVSRTTELGRDGSAFGVPFQLFDVFKDSLDETASGLGVIERNVIRDCVQISQCRLGPDYLSHRAIRFFASSWGTVRPSSTARSPRAIPRSISSCLWR